MMKEKILKTESEIVHNIPGSHSSEWRLLFPMKATVEIYVCGNSQTNVNKAIEQIQNKVKVVTDKQVIRNEAIKRISLDERNKIREYTKQFDVKIAYSSSKGYHTDDQITLEGFKDDVWNAYDKIKSFLHEFDAAETCSTFVRWQKQKSSSKIIWEDLPLIENFAVETAYSEWIKNNKNPYGRGIVPSSILINISNESFKIDFQDVEADPTGLKSTGIRRRILQQDESRQDLPAHWASSSVDSPCDRVTLSHTRNEYQMVATKFRSSGIKYKMIKSEIGVYSFTIFFLK